MYARYFHRMNLHSKRNSRLKFWSNALIQNKVIPRQRLNIASNFTLTNLQNLISMVQITEGGQRLQTLPDDKMQQFSGRPFLSAIHSQQATIGQYFSHSTMKQCNC